MKTKILKFFSSRLGFVLKPFISAGVGALGTQLARLGIELSIEDQAKVTAWLTAAIFALIQFWIDSAESKTKRETQEALGAEPDGYIGPKTVIAAEKATVAAGTPRSKEKRRPFFANNKKI